MSYIEHKVKPFTSIYKVLLDRYELIPSESVFIDDKEKNIIIGISLGIISKEVEPDNYASVFNVIKKLDFKLLARSASEF